MCHGESNFGDSLSKKCDGRHEHAPCAGRETSVTQVYTSNSVSTIVKKVNEDIDVDRVVLSDDESRRTPLRVRTRGNKSKVACVVLITKLPESGLIDPTFRDSNHQFRDFRDSDHSVGSDFHIHLSESCVAACVLVSS